MRDTFNGSFILNMSGCKQCGCPCNRCINNNSLDLHHEIEELQAKVRDCNNRMGIMEREYTESREYSDSEIAKLQDELIKIRDRYDRIFESHKKMQRVNHDLEDNILKLVTKYENEKKSLQKDVINLNNQVLDSKIAICDLEEENARFRNDCNVAVQLLQCKPSNFVSHKLDSLPIDIQDRLKVHLSQQQLLDFEKEDKCLEQESRMIKVPMSTFPPTAMFYSVNSPAPLPTIESPNDVKQKTVPVNLIAKVLAQPETKYRNKHIHICKKCCTVKTYIHQEIQSDISYGGDKNNFHGHTIRSVNTIEKSNRPRFDSTETEII